MEINGRAGWRKKVRRPEPKAETREVMNAERKALRSWASAPDSTLADVKSKYRALVRQHHPDANGGDRSAEDTA